MSYIRTSFYYDPIRQGYDTNSWRTISGAPAIVNGRLSVDNQVGVAGCAVHYADLTKGDVSFDVNVPVVPVEGTYRIFGLAALNSSAYIEFSINGGLVCKTSDGITSTDSSVIPWSSSWTGVNTIFRIKWEAGIVNFYINGTRIYTVSDASIPYGPLSLYLYDEAESSMTFGDISVKGTQSFVMNPKTTDTSSTATSGKLSVSQGVTVTENIVILIPSLKIPFIAGGMFESVTVSDVISLYQPKYTPLITQNVTVSENVALTRV